MASNTDFVQYIADQCSGAGEIIAKKMFGDYGIYCDGKIFGLICDDCFYLKPTDAVRPLLRVIDMAHPTTAPRTTITLPTSTTVTTSHSSSAKPARPYQSQSRKRRRNDDAFHLK